MDDGVTVRAYDCEVFQRCEGRRGCLSKWAQVMYMGETCTDRTIRCFKVETTTRYFTANAAVSGFGPCFSKLCISQCPLAGAMAYEPAPEATFHCAQLGIPFPEWLVIATKVLRPCLGQRYGNNIRNGVAGSRRIDAHF